MLRYLLIYLFLIFTNGTFAQIADTSEAFAALQPFYGDIDLTQSMETWKINLLQSTEMKIDTVDAQQIIWGHRNSNLIPLPKPVLAKEYNFHIIRLIVNDSLRNRKDTFDKVSIFWSFDDMSKKDWNLCHKYFSNLLKNYFSNCLSSSQNNKAYKKTNFTSYKFHTLDAFAVINLDRAYDTNKKLYRIGLHVTKGKDYLYPEKITYYMGR